jgi:sec-independent protein translocase protein TatA
MLPHFGPMELVIILVIALMVFGAGKLPEVGSALGRGIKEFKKATTDEPKEISSGTSTPVPPATTATTAPVGSVPSGTPLSGSTATAANPYCPQCGAQSTSESRFCPRCGASLPTAAA